MKCLVKAREENVGYGQGTNIPPPKGCSLVDYKMTLGHVTVTS